MLLIMDRNGKEMTRQQLGIVSKCPNLSMKLAKNLVFVKTAINSTVTCLRTEIPAMYVRLFQL